MVIAGEFCSFFDSLGKSEEIEESPHYSSTKEHTVINNVQNTPLGHQLQILLDFEDQKQEASAFLGRDGGLQEFLSIVFTGEVLFLTEEAKIATALDLLSGELSEQNLSSWPSWKLQELLEFLYFRVRALERSRRLTLAGTFDTNLNKKKGQTESKDVRPLSKLLMNSKIKGQKAQPFAAIPDLFHEQTRKPTWKVVSEYGVDTPSLIGKIDGYLFEAGGDYNSVLPRADSLLYVQDADLDISYYEEYFARRVHYNYLAYDEGGKGHVMLSMVNSDDCVRILIRTFDEDVRLKTTAPVKIPHMLKNIRYWFPSLAKVKFYAVKDLAIEKALLKIEHNHVTYNYKFGVLYCKDEQSEENDMFANEHGSDDFNEFLSFLGQEITLKGFEKFSGGLDTKNDTTGTHSVYTEIYGYEVMFHVSTMLPYANLDPQQLERKRHLGNDVIVIIFKEGDQLFNADCLRSEFNHVFIVVQKFGVDDDGNTLYKLELSCKDSVVQPWRPLFTDPPVFKKGDAFRDWLLTKCINAERACMHAPSFIKKFERTRKMLFEDLFERYVPAHVRKNIK